MKNKYLRSLLPFLIIFVLILSPIGTKNVLADDNTPPTSTDTPPTEALPTETPVVTEPAPTEVSAETESVPTDIPAETEAAPTDIPAEEVTVPEILAQLPAETDLLITDQNGEVLPLASADAANILIAGDPQWCMEGYTPADDPAGGTFCTAKFTYFNGLGGLIEELNNGTGIDSGNGTIFVSYDYDPSTTPGAVDTGGIYFDYGSNSLGDLVFQGGWDFASNSVVGTTTFNNTQLWFDGWDSALTIKDIVITKASGSSFTDCAYSNTWSANVGLVVTCGFGDVNVDNVTSTNNDTGAYIESYNNVDISNSRFDNNVDDGLDVYSEQGNITLTSVVTENNGFNGAYLEAGCYCTPGNIFINSSTFDFNGAVTEGRGLVAHATGDITLASISASLNGGGGAELINCFFDFFGTNTCLNTNPGKITLTGTNTFTQNGYNPAQFLGSGPYASVGLWVGSNSDVSLDGVTANMNGAGDMGGGALVFTENGSISITNSSFNDNCTVFYCSAIGFGLIAIDLLGSGTALTGINANGNGNGDGISYNSSSGVGVIVFNLSGGTSIERSNFNGNCIYGSCGGGGIMSLTAGNVHMNHVNANSNGSVAGGGGGAMIMAGGNVDIYCSTFKDNLGIGLGVEIPSGSNLSLNGVTLSGNLTDFAPPTSGGTWAVNPFDCNPVPPTVDTPVSKINETQNPALPFKIVKVLKEQKVELDCVNFRGTKLITENGNSILIPCPLGGSSSLVDKTLEGLPGPLPIEADFKSAFTAAISGNGVGQLSRPVLISFVVPEGLDASKLGILFWDGTQWIEVTGSFVREDQGVTYFEAYTNFAGTFVLVQK